MRPCKHLLQPYSHSVEQIFAPWFEKKSGDLLAPNQSKGIQLSEFLIFFLSFFSVRQLLVHKNEKNLAFVTEVKLVSLTLP